MERSASTPYRGDDRIVPLIGVLCCNEHRDRPVQVVATRFLSPLRTFARLDVLLIPAINDGNDMAGIAARLDAVLLTGSRSHVSPHRYAGSGEVGPRDEARDAVAFTLADRMIERGKPVFGICRGLQEINVLFGGTLTERLAPGVHHNGAAESDYRATFAHRHSVALGPAGLLAHLSGGTAPIEVNSIHHQGIERLGSGLAVEARATDGLVEAVSARPNGASVLGVQWHPECDTDRSLTSERLFEHIGIAARGEDQLLS